MSRQRSFPWGAATATAAAVVVLAGAGGLLMASTHGTGATSSALSATAGARTGGSVAGATTGTGDGSSTAVSPSSGTGSTAPSGLPTGATGNRGTSTASTVPPGHVVGTTPPTTRPVGAGSSAPATGPAPAVPGTYHYRQVATLPGTPAEGSLVVAPASASGTQVWTRLVGGTIKASTSVMLFNAHGTYLVSPGSLAVGAQASCSFPTPVPWPPWPITAGGSVSSHAACTGAVSSLQVAGRVGGTAAMALDGQTVNTSIVVNTFVLHGTFNGSPLDAALTETDYYAPSLRVPVLTRTHVSGTAIGLPVTTDRTDTLESATPS